jgi:hypothetical protein
MVAVEDQNMSVVTGCGVTFDAIPLGVGEGCRIGVVCLVLLTPDGVSVANGPPTTAPESTLFW